MSPLSYSDPTEGKLRQMRTGTLGLSYTPDDFQLRVTEPNASNTGSRIAQVSLTPHNGDLTAIPAGAPLENGIPVISGLEILGRISLAVPYVKVRDCIIRGNTNQSMFISCTSAAITEHWYEHVTIRPPTPFLSNGITGGNFNLIRADIAGVTDGGQIYGANKTVRIHGVYVHDFLELFDGSQDDQISHNDCFQFLGGLAHLEVIGASLGRADGTYAGATRPNTSTMLVQVSQGAYTGPITVHDNWLYGKEDDGATFHMSEPAGGFGPGAMSVLRNRVADDSKHPVFLVKPNSRYPQNFGCTGTVGNTNDWVGGPDANVYMTAGTPIPINNG